MQLTERQREFLNEVHFAVVATVAGDGMPHQTVTWYMLDGDQLLLNIPRASLKHKHLKRDPRISVCIEKAYSYITLTGTVTLDENPSTARADYERLGRRYTGTFNMAAPPPRAQGGQGMPSLLSRERVTVHVTIDGVQSNGLG